MATPAWLPGGPAPPVYLKSLHWCLLGRLYPPPAASLRARPRRTRRGRRTWAPGRWAVQGPSSLEADSFSRINPNVTQKLREVFKHIAAKKEDGRKKSPSYGMARLGLLKLLLFAGTQRMYGERLVSWLPTPADMATAALEWAEVGPSDVVYELGCGDGSVALAAAQRGARVVCVEIDEDLARGAEEIVKHAGLAHRVTVLQVTI